MKKSVLLNGIVVGEIVATDNPLDDARAAKELLDQKGLSKNRDPAAEIFATAFSFATISAYLYENGLKRRPTISTHIVPFVVNAAFAIELYFKSLAKKHGKALRGHELYKLYLELPPQALKEINDAVPGCANDRKISSPNFSEYVLELNDSFVAWRYIYEKSDSEGIRVEETIFVMQVLHDAFNSTKSHAPMATR